MDLAYSLIRNINRNKLFSVYIFIVIVIIIYFLIKIILYFVKNKKSGSSNVPGETQIMFLETTQIMFLETNQLIIK